MVLDLAKKGSKDLPLKQRDVRETAGISGTPIIGDFTSSQHSHAAAGATGGTVDHANLTSIGTNSHAQVDTHIGNTANPHSVVLTDLASPGEGIDFSGTDIQGENASDTNKGIAVFPIADFTVTAGSVALKAIVVTSIDGDSGTATPAVHNIDILGGTGITTAAAGNDLTITNAGVTSAVAGAGIDVSGATGAVTITAEDSTAGNKGIVIVAGGEGMDVSYASGTATVAGEDATTSNKGIASFNSNNFAVGAGSVTLAAQGTALNMNTHLINNVTDPSGNQDAATKKYVDDHALANKTSYWSCSGQNFHARNPDVDDIVYGTTTSTVLPEADTLTLMAPVFLPQGAVVTGVICYGNAAAEAETWTFQRANFTGTTNEMATAAFNTADTSITSGTIDNSAYCYWFSTSTMDTNDTIYGAVITYTTDYI